VVLSSSDLVCTVLIIVIVTIFLMFIYIIVIIIIIIIFFFIIIIIITIIIFIFSYCIVSYYNTASPCSEVSVSTALSFECWSSHSCSYPCPL
jgi:hypothetical protein